MTNDSRSARGRGRAGGARAPRARGFIDLHEGVLGEFTERAAVSIGSRAHDLDVRVTVSRERFENALDDMAASYVADTAVQAASGAA